MLHAAKARTQQKIYKYNTSLFFLIVGVEGRLKSQRIRILAEGPVVIMLYWAVYP